MFFKITIYKLHTKISKNFCSSVPKRGGVQKILYSKFKSCQISGDEQSARVKRCSGNYFDPECQQGNGYGQASTSYGGGYPSFPTNNGYYGYQSFTNYNFDSNNNQNDNSNRVASSEEAQTTNSEEEN